MVTFETEPNPALMAMWSSPSEIYESLMVMLEEAEGSIPSVLVPAPDVEIFAPQTVRPLLMAYKWNLVEFCRVVLYSVKLSELAWVLGSPTKIMRGHCPPLALISQQNEPCPSMVP